MNNISSINSTDSIQVSVEQYSPDQVAAEITAIALKYKNIFAQPPWNEAYKCDCEGSYYPLNTAVSTCSTCNQPLTDFYNLTQLKQDIVNCNQLPEATLVVAKAQGSIVGFAWGWQENITSLNERKFQLEPNKLQQLQDSAEINTSDQLYYFSEFGVEQNFRGRGIGTGLFTTLLTAASSSAVRKNIVRTSEDSSAYSIAQKNALFPFTQKFAYNDAQKRVILTNNNQSQCTK